MFQLLDDIRNSKKVISNWDVKSIFLSQESELTSLTAPKGPIKITPWSDLKFLLSRMLWLTKFFSTAPNESVIIYKSERPYLPVLKRLFPMLKFVKDPYTGTDPYVYRFYDFVLTEEDKIKLETSKFVSTIATFSAITDTEIYDGVMLKLPFGDIRDTTTQVIITSKNKISISGNWYTAALMYFNIAIRNDNDGTDVRTYRNPITNDLRSYSELATDSSYDSTYMLYVVDSYLSFADSTYRSNSSDIKYGKALSLSKWIRTELTALKEDEKLVLDVKTLSRNITASINSFYPEQARRLLSLDGRRHLKPVSMKRYGLTSEQIIGDEA